MPRIGVRPSGYKLRRMKALRPFPTQRLTRVAAWLAAEVATRTAASPNETSLMHEIESLLERACMTLSMPWTPFRLELSLTTDNPKQRRFVDVAHGAVVIEYEAPNRFSARDGAQLEHARAQALEYATLLSREEGRQQREYVLVAWDGAHISFGCFSADGPTWDTLQAFDRVAAERLLRALCANGTPLVHPRLLAALVGPESESGRELIPRFYAALTRLHPSPKTRLMFTEWRRLFGQVVGVQSEQLKALLARQGLAHAQPYDQDPGAYLFALNTYIALVAKVVAALSLPGVSEDLRNRATPIEGRIEALESGKLFQQAGIVNMLSGDFFSWYSDDSGWVQYRPSVDALISRLSGVNFDTARKGAEATRDLFKGMYQSFVPRALRHALGEFYTPDWLASHALDCVSWSSDDSMLDPTCGTGTFVLEALRRRLGDPRWASKSARELLDGLYGLDLNPLAVLAARASLVVYLAGRMNQDDRRVLRLPIYLADAINPANSVNGRYRHELQTELGIRTFEVPAVVVEHAQFFEIFTRIRELVDASYSGSDIRDIVSHEFRLRRAMCEGDKDAWLQTLNVLVELHDNQWNGIWCSIVAERLAAGAIPQTAFICGNPPWVKWSHLPPEYAEFIKPRCMELGVFSQDRWVGGIESDISTVITYEVIAKWLAPKGVLAFFITGTVFSNESSQGFRRFHLTGIDGSDLTLGIIRVEDFNQLHPFEGVTNWPTLLIVRRDVVLRYPTTYRVWRAKSTIEYPDGAAFRAAVKADDLLAQPVPGTDAGPWLKGTLEQHDVWQRLFAAGEPAYQARKGVTTDLNGLYFVRPLKRRGAMIEVVNDPTLGRRHVPRREGIVEIKHTFPLIRGRGVTPFKATVDPDYVILVPQSGMHGDRELPKKAPEMYRYLSRFRAQLQQRSSYRRFQRNHPFWSLWSTGPYTFSAFKVLWREMGGGSFAAAYVGSVSHPLLGKKVVVPDHKVYFVPCETEEEAAYLTAILNSRLVATAVAAYAAQLSLGVSVVEYLRIPRFSAVDKVHFAVARLGVELTKRADRPTRSELQALDHHVQQLF